MDHDHLPALAVLLYAAPLMLLALAMVDLAAGRGWGPAMAAVRRAAAAPRDARGAALLLLLAGWIHLGLVPGHRQEPLFALAFVAAGLGMLAAAGSALLAMRSWRPVAGAAAAGALAAYVATRLAGIEGIDALGVVSGLLEAGALALAMRRAPVSLGVAHAT